VSKASTFLEVFVFLCWREFREWLQFFLQGYLVIHFAVMKIALVEMKIGKAYSLPLVRLSVRKRRGKGGKHKRSQII